MEIVIVVLIVAAAAVYVGRRFYRGLTRKEACACGCSCCDVGDPCETPTGDRPGGPSSAGRSDG